MTDDTFTYVDREEFGDVCLQVDVERIDDYHAAAPLAFATDSWKAAIQFFIEMSDRDAALATNLLDVMRRDDLLRQDENVVVYYFPGYALPPLGEDEEGGLEIDDPID
jgi:hypothetical protein